MVDFSLSTASYKCAMISPTSLMPRQASKRSSKSMIGQGKKLQFGPVESTPDRTSRLNSSSNCACTRVEVLNLMKFFITRDYSNSWPTTSFEVMLQISWGPTGLHCHSLRRMWWSTSSFSQALVVNQESHFNCRWQLSCQSNDKVGVI